MDSMVPTEQGMPSAPIPGPLSMLPGGPGGRPQWPALTMGSMTLVHPMEAGGRRKIAEVLFPW